MYIPIPTVCRYCTSYNTYSTNIGKALKRHLEKAFLRQKKPQTVAPHFAPILLFFSSSRLLLTTMRSHKTSRTVVSCLTSIVEDIEIDDETRGSAVFWSLGGMTRLWARHARCRAISLRMHRHERYLSDSTTVKMRQQQYGSE
jgi:hypothetical protein